MGNQVACFGANVYVFDAHCGVVNSGWVGKEQTCTDSPFFGFKIIQTLSPTFRFNSFKIVSLPTITYNSIYFNSIKNNLCLRFNFRFICCHRKFFHRFRLFEFILSRVPLNLQLMWWSQKAIQITLALKVLIIKQCRPV